MAECFYRDPANRLYNAVEEPCTGAATHVIPNHFMGQALVATAGDSRLLLCTGHAAWWNARDPWLRLARAVPMAYLVEAGADAWYVVGRDGSRRQCAGAVHAGELADALNMHPPPITRRWSPWPRTPETIAAEEREHLFRVRTGRCPICHAMLTEVGRSPGGWRHCRRCRRGWRLEERPGGRLVAAGRDWPRSASPPGIESPE